MSLKTQAKTDLLEIQMGLYLAISAFFVMLMFTTVFMAMATLGFFFLTLGLYFKQNRLWHVRFMTAGISIDLVIVLILQMTRNAVQTAVAMKLGPLNMLHIGFSSLATAFYFPVLFLGWQLVKGNLTHRALHVRIASLAYVFRALGFIFMFSLLFKK